MNTIAGLLTFYMPEQDAFFCFNEVMRRRQIIYKGNLHCADQESKIIEEFMEKMFPKLLTHLRVHDVPVSFSVI